MDSSHSLDLSDKVVLIATDIYGQAWNMCVLDHTTGTNLLTYKNCSTVPHGLGFIRDSYMICAVYNKPYLVYWNLKGKNSQPAKIHTASFVSCLDVTSCGNFIAIGIEEKVFVLQTYAGRIVGTITKHFQNVTNVKFSKDLDYLITASDDTTILVWNFNEVLNTESQFLKPVFTWNGHSMKINDIYVSPTSDLVVSASADLTCKIWDLNSENSTNVMSALFEDVPTRCILDYLETYLYVGLSNGDIHRILVKSLLFELNKTTPEPENSTKALFLGHKQKITSLTLTSDDMQLASGSEDASIRIWNVFNQQCIKIINMTCGISNLQFKPRNLFINDEANSETPLATRYVNDRTTDEVVCVRSEKQNMILTFDDFLKDDDQHSDEYFDLKNKYEKTRNVTNKIYNFTLNRILNNNQK